MKGSNRFLVGFGIGVGALVALTVVIVFTVGGRTSPLLPDTTPPGVVQRFLIAVQNRDLPAAYSYLGPDQNGRKVAYEDWARQFPPSANMSGWKASLGATSTLDDTATVEVIIETFRPNGPFGDPVRTLRTNFFLKRDGATWKIAMPADIYWLY